MEADQREEMEDINLHSIRLTSYIFPDFLSGARSRSRRFACRFGILGMGLHRNNHIHNNSWGLIGDQMAHSQKEKKVNPKHGTKEDA